MSYAFEITPEDIQQVAMNEAGVELTDADAELAAMLITEEDEARMLEGIDHLCDLDEQTAAVYKEIAVWLKVKGII